MPKSHRGAVTRAAVVTTSAAVAAAIAALPATASAPASDPAAGPAAATAVLAAPIPQPSVTPAPAPVPVVAPAPAEAAPTAQADAATTRKAVEVKPVAFARASSAAATALEHALDQKGDPYRWGGTGPDAFDCSGLVVYAFKKAGVDLPRTSRAQSKVGEKVSKDELRPGDLVFFYRPVSHVGIYLGGGKIVHASTSGKPVKVSDMGGMEFNSARRV